MSTETKNQEHAAEAASYSAYDEILAAISPYMESARTGDGASILPTLSDDFRVTGHMDGELVHLASEPFAGLISEIGPTADVQSRVVSVEREGRSAAVRIEFLNWAGLRFTDFILLYRQDDGWKLKSKVFSSHSRS